MPPVRHSTRVASPEVERALVVEDNPALLRTLERVLGERAQAVRSCRTVAEARDSLESWLPELVLLDVDLPDGDAFSVLKLMADASPAPVVIAMSGVASPDASFRLAQLGVRAYLTKPLRLDVLANAITEALGQAPDVTPLVRSSVGHVPVRELERHVRRTMVDEALAKAEGNRRRAARLLKVSRQLLQHMLRSAKRA